MNPLARARQNLRCSDDDRSSGLFSRCSRGEVATLKQCKECKGSVLLLPELRMAGVRTTKYEASVPACEGRDRFSRPVKVLLRNKPCDLLLAPQVIGLRTWGVVKARTRVSQRLRGPCQYSEPTSSEGNYQAIAATSGADRREVAWSVRSVENLRQRNLRSSKAW
jgi:hypothetical protein